MALLSGATSGRRAWQAALEPLFFGIVLVGLAGWSWIAWSGTVRALARRRRRSR